MRERGGPGGADWLAGAGVGGAAGGWAAGEPAGRSPRGARRRRVPVRLPRPRCARVSASLRPGVPRGHPRHHGPAFRGPPGQGSGPPCSCPGLLAPLSVRLGLPRPGEGAGSGLCLPPHAPPRGPDSGVRGRTGDARPVYPPRAASAPTGGAARAGEGEGSPPRACDLPWARHPGSRDPQSLLPRTHQSGLSSLCLLPPPGVCCLVLVALSLWPDRAAAPGPPPGPPRASPDPRAELDSAVLLTRSLLADTRQLAAQLVGEPARGWAGPGTRSVEGFWARTETAGGGSLGPVCRMGGPLELGRVPLKASFSPQRDKFPADGDHNLDSLPTLAMSAGALGALQVRGGEGEEGAEVRAGRWPGCTGGWGPEQACGRCSVMPPMPCLLAPRCADAAAGRPVLLPAARAVAAAGGRPFLADPGAGAGRPAGPAGQTAAPAAAPGTTSQLPGPIPRLET